MIVALNALQLQEQKSFLLEQLKKYESISYLTPELLLNQVIRGELTVFNVNNELLALCKRFISGNDYVFFVSCAFSTLSNGFFGFRTLVRNHFSEICSYIKQDLGCDRLEFMCVGNAHAQMYKTILNKCDGNFKHEHYFKMVL